MTGAPAGAKVSIGPPGLRDDAAPVGFAPALE